jgi:hypothetical protein
LSQVLDPVGPAPETRQPRFLWLLLGCAIAPLFWLGQMMLDYGVTAQICYPGDHPVSLVSAGPLFAMLLASDVIALGACAAGAFVSWRIWRRGTGKGRDRFLALWGMMSSLWFFGAILFNVFASILVPPCQG